MQTIDTETRREMQWLDVELIVERDIDRAAYYGKQSDLNLILAGRHTHRVVGKYERYGAIAISDKSGRSVSSVQNWANAYKMLVWLFRYARLTGNWGVRANWRTFSPTHYWTLWEKCRKYLLTLDEATAYLLQMLDYRTNGDSWSADVLAREIDVHEDKSGRVAGWSYYQKRVLSLLSSAFVSAGIPADIKPLVAKILQILESRKETA